MKNEIRLTERELKKLAANPPGKRSYFTDDGEKGLRIEVSPAGTIKFFARIRVKKRQKTFTPGLWPAVSLGEARFWIQNLKADLNRQIPVADSSHGKVSLSKFFDDRFLSDHLKVRAPKSWKTELSLFNSRIRESIGHINLREIERSDITGLHNQVLADASPRTANRVKTLIHRMYSFAIDEGEIVTGNPASRIKNFKEQSRDRFLMEHEVPAFFRAVMSEDVQPWFRDYLLLSLFTGARQANILAMKKSCIIPGLPTWRIPEDEFKGERVHFVPLVKQAAAIVQARAAAEPGDLLFPANSRSGCRTRPKKKWKALCEGAGLNNIRMHDLRATLGTWAEERGVPETIRGKMLGHIDGGVIARYSRSRIQTVLEHFQPVADAIEEAGKREDGDKIVHIKDVGTQ